MKVNWFLTFIINIAFVFLFLYSGHFYYQSKIQDRPQVMTQVTGTHLTNDHLLRLGHFDQAVKETSFIRAERKKKPGVTRIGFFGDSHTFGNEVASSKNFPSLLQKMVGDDIEIINFGNGWYSFAQSFILWQLFYREFDLDIVVYGPRGFHPERNLTFNHTEDNYPSYMHSRFVIDQNQSLKELVPEGSTDAERINNYYSFFPSEYYWKYDRRGPSFLRAYEYFIGKKLKNPFYHTNESEEVENNALVGHFLKTMATYSPRLIILSDNYFLNQTNLAQAIEGFNNSSLILIPDHLSTGVPFSAQMGHSSVYGNQLIANQLYESLQSDLGLPMKEFTAIPEIEFHIADDLFIESVDSFSRLYLYFNNQKMGYLGGAYPQGTLTEQEQYAIKTDFSKNHSLIALECPRGQLTNSLILGIGPPHFSKALDVQNIGQTNIFLKLSMLNCHFDEGLNSLMVELDSFQNQPLKILNDGVYLESHKLFEQPLTTYKDGIAYYQLKPSTQAYKFAVFPDADETILRSKPTEVNQLTIKLEPLE